jgi:uncharacterized membrane protein HdeD (DUF308 family)
MRPGTPQGARDRFYESHAWILMILMGLLLVVAGIAYVVEGLAETDPARAQVHRSWGIFEAAFGLLVVVVTVGPYRRREHWSWFALWLVPAAFIAELVNVWAAGMNPVPLGVFATLATLGLLLPVRTFFGRGAQTKA